MSADLILSEGRIFTLGRGPWPPSTHLAVSGGRVTAVGGREVLGLRDPNTRVWNLRGATVLPGFVDAHAHVVYSGLTSFGVQLSGARDIPSLAGRLRAGLGRLEPGEWLQGRGYVVDLLRERRHPTRQELDAGTGGRPAFIDDRGGHARVANSAALAEAGIGASTPDPPGGTIVRDSAGEPTGLLLETAMRLVADRQPPPSRNRRRAGILKVQRLLNSRGITAVGAAVNRGFADDLLVYSRLDRESELRLRINAFLSWELLEAAEGLGVLNGFGGAQLTAGPVKVFVDGGMAPVGSGEAPQWRTSPEELREIVARAQAAGLRVAAHAIGRPAITAMLDAVEGAGPGSAQARHRIEHFTFADRAQQDRAARLGVVAVMQPAIASRRSWLARRVGPEMAAAASPHRDVAKAKIAMAFSSDLPVAEDPNPWVGIAAVLRDRGQRLSVRQALRAYTVAGAFAACAEADYGSLEPGRFADFQVYVRDVLSLAPRDAKKSRPALVALGGRPVYRARISSGKSSSLSLTV